MTELKQYPNIRKVDAFELDDTVYICYVDKCNPNNIVWMKVDRADPEKDLETYNLLEKLRIEVKMTTDYKQLSQELYEMLKEIRDVIKKFEVPPVLDYKVDRMDNVLQKYEDETTRGTGRTTALYMKAIAEALAKPGEQVEFQDHYPLTWENIKPHADNLKNIITKLGYDIVVSVIASNSNKDNKIILTNRFKK